MRVQAEIRLRHADVVQTRKARGWSQRELAQQAGVPMNHIQDLEKMQFKRARVRASALKVAATLGLNSDAVLPPDMEEDIVSTIKMTRDVDTTALIDYSDRLNSRLLLPGPDAEAIDHAALQEELERVMATLTFREREIIRLRYGMSDAGVCTLEEVARRFHVTRERARSIEAKALRKLQHPARSKRLEAFLEDVGVPKAPGTLPMRPCPGCKELPAGLPAGAEHYLIGCETCEIWPADALEFLDAAIAEWNELVRMITAYIREGYPLKRAVSTAKHIVATSYTANNRRARGHSVDSEDIDAVTQDKQG